MHLKVLFLSLNGQSFFLTPLFILKFLLLFQANSTPVVIAITTTNYMLAYTIHSLSVLIRASPPFVTFYGLWENLQLTECTVPV